jgi:hypothetical protein
MTTSGTSQFGWARLRREYAEDCAEFGDQS